MGGPPDVWTLTQLRTWIVMARYKAHPGMSRRELDEMTSIARTYPSLDTVYRLAVALALNDQEDEARAWLSKICKFTSKDQCSLAQRSWVRDSAKDQRTAAIEWLN